MKCIIEKRGIGQMWGRIEVRSEGWECGDEVGAKLGQWWHGRVYKVRVQRD